jgi:hypothetical protein
LVQPPPALTLNRDDPFASPNHPKILKTLPALLQLMILEASHVAELFDLVNTGTHQSRICREHTKVIHITANTRLIEGRGREVIIEHDSVRPESLFDHRCKQVLANVQSVGPPHGHNCKTWRDSSVSSFSEFRA